MKKSWIIAPWEHGRASWEKIWDYDYSNNLISIGWSWLGDAINARDEKSLKERIKRLQPNAEKDRSVFRKVNFFINEIAPGDIILARKGLKEVIGIGVCNGPAFFDDNRALNSSILFYDHKIFLPVTWNKSFVPVIADANIFTQPTIEPLRDKSKLPDKIRSHLVTLRNQSAENSARAYYRIDLDHIELGNEFPDRLLTHGYRFQRDESVRKAVLRRADGACEYCGKKGFITKDGDHYLETHHIIALSADGPDTIRNVIALCSEHHREAHYGMESMALEMKFLDIIKTKNEPNKAVEPTSMAVTNRAPSSTNRASHARGSL